MATTVWRNKDFLAGCLLLGLGLFLGYVGLSYSFGTPRRMGPGFMPVCLSALLALLGLALIVRARRSGAGLGSLSGARPLVVVLGSVIAFSFMLEPLGLVLASFTVVLIACCAQAPIRPLESLALAVGLTAGVVLLFVVALGVPLELWPRGL